MKKFDPRLLLIVSMTVFGTLGLFVRNISVSSGELALYRAVLAALLIGVYLLVSRQRIPFARIKKEVPLLLLSGAAMVQIGPFLAEGRGRFHPELLLTCREAVRLGEEVRRFSRKCPVPLRFAGELFCSCRSDAACIRPPGVPEDYRPAPCSVEERFLVVGPAGKCRRCLHLPEEAGDVRRFAGMAN